MIFIAQSQSCTTINTKSLLSAWIWKKLLQKKSWCLILSCWHYCPLVCVSLQSSLCVFPSSSSWGCCHKSTRSSCTSLSSWTSMCSGAMVSDLYMHNFSAGVTLTSTEWDNRHTYIYYVKAGFVKSADLHSVWPPCLSGWVASLLTPSLCSLQPPQAFCQHCTASCAALSPSLCFMASATELWRWDQSQLRGNIINYIPLTR